MLSIADLLSIRHPELPRWSPNGQWITYFYTVDGLREVWAVPAAGGEPQRLSGLGHKVSAWDWAPHGVFAYASGNAVYSLEHPGAEPVLLLDGQEPVSEVKWSPDGKRLGVLRKGKLLLLGQAPILREVPVPGAVGPTFHWSPDGTRVACLILEHDQRDVAVVAITSGELLWRSQTTACEYAAAWLGPDHLSVTRITMDSILREYLLVSLPDGTERLVAREEDERGLKMEIAPVTSPTGDAIAYTLEADGWLHVHLWEAAAGSLKLLLPGAHEDVGHANDKPAFSPDGRYLLFPSSMGTLQQRQLWQYDRADGAVKCLTAETGTNVNAAWSPDGGRIAYIACGPSHSAEVAVMAADGSGRTRLTHSMPPAWRTEAIAAPQHITYEGVGGLRVHADLILPHNFDPNRRYPALVYIHGGPMRQMRYGWHPLHPYAVFYGFNQVLRHHDYVTLSVDYRGGTGYGQEYEKANYLQFAQAELDDCLRGGEYLKALPYVDAERVGIWGLSYGGYMTLAALTKSPETFAMGVNIAGVWDQEQWARWRGKKDAGYPLVFVARWGGPKGPHNEEVYRQISPRNFVAGLQAPLLNLHGTDDEAVDFGQLDQIVKDCTEHRKDFAVAYYPGESHMFTARKTWEDAFRRMLAAFDRYLKVAPSERPCAML